VISEKRSQQSGSQEHVAKASIQLEFPGNHLFKEIAGHARAETNIVGLFWYDPKRLPSRGATDRPIPS
jgi:hypothetical protein